MGTLTASLGVSGTSVTDDTTLATGATVTAAIGDILVVGIAAANTGTNGVARTATVADNAASSTNVYTQRGTTGNATSGTAGDGASQFWFECPVTTTLSGNIVTVTFSGNVAQKVVIVLCLTPAATESAIFSAVGTASAGMGVTTHSAATVGVTIDYTIVTMAAVETDDTITGDSDTTNGSWNGLFGNTADGGLDAACMQGRMDFKTVTATGDQAWACTTSSSRDSARNYIIYRSGTPAVGGAFHTMIRCGGVITVP